MGFSKCCVVACKIPTKERRLLKLYRFPTINYKLEQRDKWIEAVRKANSDPLWVPKQKDVICSAHFIGGQKSSVMFSPSYVPMIFPGCPKPINDINLLNKHNRFIKQRAEQIQIKIELEKEKMMRKKYGKGYHSTTEEMPLPFETVDVDKLFLDKGCQVEIFSKNVKPSESFTCNTYIYSGCNYADVAIQTEIIEGKIVVIPNSRKYKDKGCNTEKWTFTPVQIENDTKKFFGIESIKNSEELVHLTGMTANNFYLLLQKLPESTSHKTFNRENKLLIFLAKLKLGLTFSALGVLFSLQSRTISKIFHSTLEELVNATSDIISCPSKEVIQSTTPAFFDPDFRNTRLVVECLDLKIEIPTVIAKKFSNDKNISSKLILAFTPGGFISFKSKVMITNTNDSQMITKSGFIDLLEDGDTILATKDYPELRQAINDSTKNITLLMPPFNEKKPSTKDYQPYNIARVRFHVERLLHRLKNFHILKEIPDNLFTNIDDIIHVCCVLVNMQTSTISTDENSG